MTDLEIHLLADSTGESGVRLARAAVAQFPHVEFRLVRHRRITTAARLQSALDALRERDGQPTAVFFTLVNEELASLVRSACCELDMPYADLMTDAMGALERISGQDADQVPMRPVGVEADYFVRIASIDFAVRNDDGAAPASLLECDICLVGPSRSGKTPLSIFLGYLGYKTVNVPLVPGIAPPEELFRIDPWRVVGLTLDPERLRLIRSERVRGLGVRGMKDGYVDLASIYDELDDLVALQRRLKCPVLDTTGMALEEAAARIVDLVEERARKHGGRLRRPANTSSTLPTS
ncbi:pyruvate, water dikinase regulatory protein [Propioniciclava soli]|uniref:pyruvate, water dikinase regulatory protein n=1 Tax=Propioniciclava soli TaxID=2775081 RepID=UPI001E62ABDA|nr:pyruvate, water dikinase regulatory protein [Propioniciclava soli]